MKAPENRKYVTLAKLITQADLVCEDLGREDLANHLREILSDELVKQARDFLYSI